jgi:hypothetical protein
VDVIKPEKWMKYKSGWIQSDPIAAMICSEVHPYVSANFFRIMDSIPMYDPFSTTAKLVSHSAT